MASVKKFKAGAVVNILRHNRRTIQNPANEDIDKNRENLNYALSPDRGMTDYQYFKQRKSEVYCHGRKDVKVMAGWVVTAPVDLPREQHRAFFESTYNFLSDRYGEKNVVQAIVHADEGGESHLHFCFLPIAPDSKRGGEKICANDILTPAKLKDFHPDLARHLKADGINANIMTGVTKAQGGNRTVRQMKQERERTIENRWEKENKHERTMEYTRIY
jgi:hypothetical protein